MMRRKQIAHDTVAILERGSYQNATGRTVEVAALVRRCVENTRCHDPELLSDVREQLLAQPAACPATQFALANETTLQGAERLAGLGVYQKIGVLNFASAKNPGGGFLGGAHAQEESLARSSALYKSLLQCRHYYDHHRAQESCIYSDWMIYSPRCPVFRRDDGTLLEQPYLVDFITSPAPNAGAIQRNEPEALPQIPIALHERSAKLLALAASQPCDALVLGAWGCGVFRNDPRMVASAFFEHLAEGGAFWGRFAFVLFSVLDTSESQRIYKAFERQGNS